MNILTNTQERLKTMLSRTDGKFKEMGKEPYGQVKLTLKEQRERFESLTPDQMMGLINQYGAEAVNEYIAKFWKEK